ncbi:galactose oxidase [Sphingobacterium sp. 1.A.5]|uniref:galactose oxidase n=1 Tax=Sphingobacterium sp. 1.A.5 TaxID=2044604 RepID=UPI000C0BF98A|nr:galactose oxidase [Sphingobacterium sp. 1.A.5]
MYKIIERINKFIFLPIIFMIQMNGNAQERVWNVLDTLPDPYGFAGSFAGKINDGIIYMGGAQFENGVPPWDSGVKIWSDKIFYLSNESGKWQEIGVMPYKCGYGASASYNGKFYIAGGSNKSKHFNEVLEISLVKGELKISQLPKLPVPTANCSFAQYGDSWYVVGGQENPNSKIASNKCFEFNFNLPENGWVELPSIPGPGRILAVAAANEKGLFVFSGASLKDGMRTYLNDGFKFDGNTWKPTAELPQSITASPNPGIELEKDVFTFISGDDGRLVDFDLKEMHPGFSKNVYSYNIKADKWEFSDVIPNELQNKDGVTIALVAPVTSTAIYWKGKIVIPGGESRPAVRTRQVLQYFNERPNQNL